MQIPMRVSHIFRSQKGHFDLLVMLRTRRDLTPHHLLGRDSLGFRLYDLLRLIYGD